MDHQLDWQKYTVLINNNGEPIGTRIFGPVTKELRAKKYENYFTSSGGTLKTTKDKRE